MNTKLPASPAYAVSYIQPTHSAPERLTSFDLLRGFAAFAVIFMHAGLVSGAITPQAGMWDSFFGFAVPFFLLASFYFAAKPSSASIGQSVKARAKRLFVPCAVWTVIYIGLKAVKFVALHQSSRVRTVLADPVGALLLGGSGVHLYFLPLLFTGLIALTCGKPLLAKAPAALLGILFLGALIADTWMVRSGNAFSLTTDHAFEHSIHSQYGGVLGMAARLMLVILAFLVRCLPLILMAFLLRRGFHRDAAFSPFTRGILRIVGLVLMLTPYLPNLLPHLELGDMLLSLGAFLVAFALSGFVPASQFVAHIGAYSFGIYLCHQVFLELLQMAFRHHSLGQHSQGPLFLSAVSLVTFVLAWLTVCWASRSGDFVKTAFAL